MRTTIDIRVKYGYNTDKWGAYHIWKDLDGNFHHPTLPAISYTDGPRAGCHFYYKHGKRHNTEGKAVVIPHHHALNKSFQAFYFREGKPVSGDEFEGVQECKK